MSEHDRLALLAHELRSPVAALRELAAALRAGRGRLAPDEGRRLLELAVAAARDVERIVVDATPEALRRERLDPGALAAGAAAAARLADPRVEADVEPGLPPLDADPARLRQALANLIGNALAHSPAGGRVVVSARHAGGRVLLAVADDGEGIPAERLARVTEPGVRYADRPGLGLGLAVARAVAEAHGGTLEISSAPGRGSTFTLALPPAAGPAG